MHVAGVKKGKKKKNRGIRLRPVIYLFLIGRGYGWYGLKGGVFIARSGSG